MLQIQKNAQPILLRTSNPPSSLVSLKLKNVGEMQHHNCPSSSPSPRPTHPYMYNTWESVPAVREQWQVCNQLGGPRATAIADSDKAQHMRLVPWAGVAARLSTSAAASPDRGDGENVTPPPRGAAYCFLPLPVITGLPVHVNGYFELSSNRRVTACPPYA